FSDIVGLGAKVDGKTRSSVIHARDENAAREAEQRFRAAFTIGEKAPSHPVVVEAIPPTGAA
ncbi:MAG TPA: thymidine phosphorylase, partial [Devosia sp.]